MIPPMVAPLPSHPSTATPMSYGTQWAANVAAHGLSQNAISPQGDIIQNQNVYNPGAYNANTAIRQPTTPLQIPVNQPSPSQNAAGYCQPQIPSGYSFVHPAILAAFAAQQTANQSRTPNYCVQPSSNPSGTVRGALLSSPGFQHVSPGTHLSHQQAFHSAPALQYIQTTPNGLQLATFSNGTPSAANCSFPHASHLPRYGSQQQTGTIHTQFRSYDPLKHFGALPQSQSHKRNKSMTTSKTNLYISGLSESDTDESVRALVEDVVRPKSCKAMLLNGKCKGSGFIDCATEEDAVKALNHLSEIAKNGGRKLNVKYALENEKDLLNVYVRNLPRTGFTKETLENLFKPYGQVTSVKLLETDGVYTGIGFVRFASAEQAQYAVESMNEARCVLVDGPGGNGSGMSGLGGKPICCKLADKADPKRRAVNAAAALAAAVAAGTNHSSSVANGEGIGVNHPLRKPNDQLSMNANPHQPNSTHMHQQTNQMSGLIFSSGVLAERGVVPLGAYTSVSGGGYRQQPPQSSSSDHPHSTSSTRAGICKIASSQSPPDPQQQLLSASPSTAVAATSTAPILLPAATAINFNQVDSRYAVAAMAVAHQQLAAVSNPAMFSRSISQPQQPMLQPAHSFPSTHQFIPYTQVPSTTPDSATALVNEFQQMNLHRPTPPLDWQAAMPNSAVTTQNGTGVLYYPAANIYNQQPSPVVPVVPMYQEGAVHLQYSVNEPVVLEEGIVIEEVIECVKEGVSESVADEGSPPPSIVVEAGNNEDANAPVHCSTTTPTLTV